LGIAGNVIPGKCGGKGHAAYGHPENNVYTQIGLVMLIGLATENAILVAEFAQAEHEQGPAVGQAFPAGRGSAETSQCSFQLLILK
jgi:hypothetical protein